MDFNAYIVSIVMVVCMCVGFIIKNIIPTDKINKFIPLILGVLGIILNTWLNKWIFTPDILVGGLVSGLASTGTFEAVKNLINTNANK